MGILYSEIQRFVFHTNQEQCSIFSVSQKPRCRWRPGFQFQRATGRKWLVESKHWQSLKVVTSHFPGPQFPPKIPKRIWYCDQQFLFEGSITEDVQDILKSQSVQQFWKLKSKSACNDRTTNNPLQGLCKTQTLINSHVGCRWNVSSHELIHNMTAAAVWTVWHYLLIYLEGGLELQVISGGQDVAESGLVRPKTTLTSLQQILTSFGINESAVSFIMNMYWTLKQYLKQGGSVLFSQILIHLVTLISVALEGKE